jgi:phosphatidyl-myo-inositol dimannoside synthase
LQYEQGEQRLARDPKAPLILGVFTGLLEPGGIAYAGRQAAAVLATLAAKTASGFAILSLNDNGLQRTTFAGIDLTIRGCGRRKGQLAREVLSYAPRVKLAYFGHCHLAPLGLALKLRGKSRYVVASHGIEVWRRLTIGRLLGLRSAAAITAPSEFTAEKLIEINRIPASRISVVPWGLRPDFGAEPREDGCKPALPNGKIILSVARLASSEQYKGIDHVIRAMQHLRSLVPDTCYVVIGKGDDLPRLKRLATELGVAERVIFTGERTDDEVACYYSAASVYAMPSLSEGMGFVFLEAMRSGKAVVAAREAAAPEVVIDGETGLLVEYGDIDELVRCLACILSDSNVRQRMGNAGLARFQQYYTFDKFETRLGNLLLNQTHS